MPNIDELICLLQLEIDQSEFEIRKFECYLNQLYEMNSAEIIVPLLSVFRDDFEYSEALFSVVHLIEAFDNETYIRELVIGLHLLERASPEWLGLLIHRIGNDEESYKVFVRHALSASDPETIRALNSTVRELRSNFSTRNGDRLARALGMPDSLDNSGLFPNTHGSITSR